MLSTITAVDPVHLHRAWPFIERGLESVRRKAKHLRWLNHDVYASIQYRAATAYIVSVGQQPVGFFVVHPQAVPFTGETELFLWIMWSAPLKEWGGIDNRTVALEAQRFIAALALQQGHSAVATLTVRRGLLRAWRDLWQSEVVSCRISQDRLQMLVGG